MDDETISVIVGGPRAGHPDPLSCVSFDSSGWKELIRLAPTLRDYFKVSETEDDYYRKNALTTPTKCDFFSCFFRPWTHLSPEKTRNPPPRKSVRGEQSKNWRTALFGRPTPTIRSRSISRMRCGEWRREGSRYRGKRNRRSHQSRKNT